MITYLDKQIAPDNDVVFLQAGRHWFGLFTIWTLTILALGLAVGLFVWLSATTDGSFLPSQDGLFWGLILLAIILALLTLLVISALYRSNKFIVTNEEVQQIIQTGLFHRRHSRLGLANVEDVTFVQKGVFATMLNYGELSVETAGEQANFKFRYCPEPAKCSKAIMDARERFFKEQDKPVTKPSTKDN